MDKILKEDCDYILRHTNIKKFNNSRILILGGNGFFATYIQVVLGFAQCKITSVSLNKPKGLFKQIYKKSKINFIQMDLNNEKKFKDLLKKKFDFIFHCATYGQPKKWSGNEWGTINLNINILKFILDHSVKYKSKILFLSSASVYAIPSNGKVIEEGSELGVGNFFNEIIYANSKIIGEKLCELYKKKHNIPVYIVRPAHTYGPGQDFQDPRVMPQLIKRALIEKKIYMFDKGKTVRTWGYISDVIIMLLNIIQSGKSLTYNVAGKDHLSIFKVAQTISKLTKNIPIKIKNKNLKFTNSKPTILKVSSSKYIKEFKPKENISFESGVNKLINWNKGWQEIK
jgi:dTDP-glucose 4,6-dehydratase/UDP-glucuronate decarboxylase